MLLDLCHASRDERERPLPGDELVPCPTAVFTHAITIAAPPENVWPWIVQMGSGRAGWYSFDHIDNGGTSSARHIIPELQQIGIGDVMPALPGAQDSFIIGSMTPPHALVLVVPLQRNPGNRTIEMGVMHPALRVSWALVLEPLEPGHTRLISRGRPSRDWLANTGTTPAASGKPILIERVYDLLARIPAPIMIVIAGAGHYVMESRMLRGVKRRVEAQMVEERQTHRVHHRRVAHQ